MELKLKAIWKKNYHNSNLTHLVLCFNRETIASIEQLQNGSYQGRIFKKDFPLGKIEIISKIFNSIGKTEKYIIEEIERYNETNL